MLIFVLARSGLFYILGASVNLGKENGLGVLLAKALGKTGSFIIHHCSAHRDQLIFQKSMESYSDFVTLEKEVNTLYRVSIMFHYSIRVILIFNYMQKILSIESPM